MSETTPTPKPANDEYRGKVCVVTGANGFVGSHLVQGLVEAGAEVRALVRETSDLTLLEGSEATLVYGDVTDRDSLEAAFDQADTVFHVAGVVKALSDATYETVNAGGSEQVCQAIETAAPQIGRLVHVSSLAAGGPSAPDRPRTETDPDEPVSIYGKSKLEGEKRVKSYADRIPVTITRPPFVYGPGDSATLDLFTALKRHLKAVVTGGPRLYSFVYVSDLVEGLLAAGASQRAIDQTYYLCSDEVMSYKAFQEAILEALGTWALYLPLPAFLMPLVGRIADWIARRRGKATVLSRQKVAEALPKAWICSPQKAADELEFVAQTKIPDGLAVQTAWYRERGWI